MRPNPSPDPNPNPNQARGIKLAHLALVGHAVWLGHDVQVEGCRLTLTLTLTPSLTLPLTLALTP